MDFFKKPAVAVILSLIVIFASTLISVSAKLNNKCDKVTDGFYSGVRYKGEDLTPLPRRSVRSAQSRM